MPQVITLDGLRTLIDGAEPVILVEALPSLHYEDAHLPGAVNLPHDRVEELAPALLPDRDALIVVYCSDAPCRNSGIASARLAALGYTRVLDYHEGKAEWRAAGLPLEHGAPVGA